MIVSSKRGAGESWGLSKPTQRGEQGNPEDCQSLLTKRGAGGILWTVKALLTKRGAGGILRTVKTYSRGEQGNPEDCQSLLTCHSTTTRCRGFRLRVRRWCSREAGPLIGVSTTPTTIRLLDLTDLKKCMIYENEEIERPLCWPSSQKSQINNG